MDSVTYARRFDKVTGSAIREIFKVLGRPGMISFAGGNPSLDALPDRLCADLARDVLLADGKRILQYGATEGYPPFLESLTAYLKSHFGFSMEGDGVLPTTGSTSGMDLLLKALVNPGDAVLVESPTFLGNMQTMHLYEANLIPIESDEGGVRLDVLEEAARWEGLRVFSQKFRPEPEEEFRAQNRGCFSQTALFRIRIQEIWGKGWRAPARPEP